MEKSVIVLDDDPHLGELVCESMRMLGVKQCHSFTSLAGLQASRVSLKADLAIIDINLGAGVPTGLDAAVWMKQCRFPGKIVFLTGHAHNHPLVTAARDLQKAQILQKPASLNTLAALLDGEHG